MVSKFAIDTSALKGMVTPQLGPARTTPIDFALSSPAAPLSTKAAAVSSIPVWIPLALALVYYVLRKAR